VTLNLDGSPQVSIVWVGLDGDEIVAGHLLEHRKARNIRNDSRVALSIETSKRNAVGLNEYLVIYGTARITEGGAAELLQNSPTPTSAPRSASRPWRTRRPGSLPTSRWIGSLVWAPGRRGGKNAYQTAAQIAQSRAQSATCQPGR
jgi:hypothetical protein